MIGTYAQKRQPQNFIICSIISLVPRLLGEGKGEPGKCMRAHALNSPDSGEIGYLPYTVYIYDL